MSELEEIKDIYQQNILAAKIEVQEQTFQHISREIHDSISLSLTLSKLHLATLNYPKPIFRHAKIDASICLIGDAIQKLRNISKSLNSDLIRENGLITAIENEIATVNQTGIYTIYFHILGTPVYLEAEKELILFRIIQEGLNNIIKHAKARNIQMQICYCEECISIELSDDGIGFDEQQIRTGSGMMNIRQRVGLLTGECDFRSKPNEGTQIHVKIPLQ